MKLQLSQEQHDNIKWVQWKNRDGVTQAHAVDPTSEERTGKLRTVTGAIIPAGAVEAEAATQRDSFSAEMVEKAYANWRKHREPKPAAAKAEKPAKEAKAERPADPPKPYELRAAGKEAELWALPPTYKEDMLVSFDRSKVDMTDTYSIKVDTSKTPATFQIRQKGKVVAKGSLERSPST